MPDERRGVPSRPIFWTVDQVANMLDLPVDRFSEAYLWYEGKDVGVYRTYFLRVVDLARGRTTTPDWRIEDSELIRWLTRHRLWVYPEIHPPVMVQPSVAPLIPKEQRGTVVVINEPPTARSTS